MKFEVFERRARELWTEIPEEYRAGVDGLQVERGARAHPSLPDVYTLGECLTESWPSEFGGPETTRSFVVLYYGSFWRLARQEEEAFDWEGELWETLTHELQHHLESLAAEDRLEEIDYAADENFRRAQGEPFDPLFFRSGEPLGGGRYRIEDEYFVEIEAGPGEASARLEWQGVAYRVGLPAERPDVLFVQVYGVPEGPASLVLVVVRPERFRDRLRRLLRGESLATGEAEGDAVPAEASGGDHE